MLIPDLAAFDKAMKEIGTAFANHQMGGLQARPTPPTAAELSAALQSLKEPLMKARDAGSGLNPWALAGIKSGEVQNCAVLAGLWSFDFGGTASRNFLAAYLEIAVPDVAWMKELLGGYRVRKELNPLGETTDRVDIIIETPYFLIAIEAKINAAFDTTQVDRYLAAVRRRAMDVGKSPMILTLTRFSVAAPPAISTTWKDIHKAAHISIPNETKSRSFPQGLILSFGQHVLTF